MYANFHYLTVRHGTTDQCLAILRDVVQPRLHEQSGFRGWLVLDDGEGTVLSLSLWATREDLKAVGGSARVREAAAGLAPMVDRSRAQVYQVLLHVPGRIGPPPSSCQP